MATLCNILKHIGMLGSISSCSSNFLKSRSSSCISQTHYSYAKIIFHLDAVYTCNWYMEYRLHICRGINWEATFSWKKCCTSAGFDDWSAWDTFVRYHFSGMPFYSPSVCAHVYPWFMLLNLNCVKLCLYHKFSCVGCRFVMRRRGDT